MKYFHKLWIKISFTVVVLIVIIMSLVTYIFTVQHVDAKRQEVQENMGRLAKQIASIRLAETEGWYVYQDWIDNIIYSDFAGNIIYIAIFDETDSLAAYALNANFLDVGDSGYLSRLQQVQIIRQLSMGEIAEESVADFDRQLVDIRWGEEFLGTVEVGFSIIELNNAVKRSLLINVTLLGAFSAIGIIASVLISRRVTKPLNQLADAMLAVKKGDFHEELTPKSRDEVGYLTNSFNEMILGLRQKETIEKFGHELGFIFDLDTLAEKVLRRMCKSTQCRRGLIFIEASKQRFLLRELCDNYLHKHDLLITQAVAWLRNADLPAPRLVEALSSDLQEGWEAFCRQWELKNTDIIVPISTRDEHFCIMVLAKKTRSTPFTEDDSRFLSTLAGQAALAIDNAMLLVEVTENERFKHELEVARNVQMRLLPQHDPKITGLDIYGICLPAEEVGGDYYDYFYLDDHRLGIAVGDVSGKGTSAAFYMAEIKGMMISLSLLMDNPREILTAVNERLYQSSDRQIFASMIYGILDYVKRKFYFARAGHMPLMFKNGKTHGEIEFLTPPGFGLGMVSGEDFSARLSEAVLDLKEGGILFFYTDGVTEARDKYRSEFGEERLQNLLTKYQSGSMEELSRSILKDIHIFSSGTKQHDDITMVAVQILSS